MSGKDLNTQRNYIYIYGFKKVICHLLPRFLGPAPQPSTCSSKLTAQLKALPAKQPRVQLLLEKNANLSS